MSAFSPSFKKSIEERIKNGSLRVSGQSFEPGKTVRSVSREVSVNTGSRGGGDSMIRMQALGRLKEREMNKTELAYSQRLDALKACGEVLWWEFESIRLRLADKTTYTPDFFVMVASGQLEVHEIKGHAMDDAMVKLKIADEIYPFRFLLIRAANNACSEWNFKEIGNRN